ncbi:MAG: Ig-like domain-containing protein [Lachnospiraceae bacterium]
MKSKNNLLVSFLLVVSLILSPCCSVCADSSGDLSDEQLEKIEEDASVEVQENTEPEDSLVPDEENLLSVENIEENNDIQTLVQDTAYQGKAVDDSGNFTNVVVFVEFADTVHNHTDSIWGECYRKNPNLLGLFQGDDAHPRAMKRYLQNISFGQMEVANIFPQYSADENKIYPYVLKNNTDYYADDRVNGDTHIIQEVTEILASSNQISLDINLDRNSDGCIDNLMIIVPCETGNKNEKFYGHKSVYSGTETVNSKQIAHYTLLPEGSVYLGSGQSGVMIHEFLHTLGCPDLYIVEGGTTGCVPVGNWDIMATTSMYVQYPLAYLRAEYLNWFTIPIVTDSKQKYSLYAASTATSNTKNNQAVILKTDYSSSEFFVLEYRKKGVQDSADPTKQDYDCKIPGSGLVIYRVNVGVKEGNSFAPPYMIYIFGQNDTSDDNGYEKADYSRMQTSFLSSESGRTSYGSSDKNDALAENALTYSDGTNSGIVISNVGSAQEDQISFDITFTDTDEASKWTLESEDTTGLSMSVLDSCRNDNGDLLYLAQTDYASGLSALLEYSDGKWTQTAEGPKGRGHKIGIYGGEIYVAYLDTSNYVRLAKWNGNEWVQLFKSTDCANEIALETSSKSVCFTYANQNGDAVYAFEYSESAGIKKLGDKVGKSTGGAANAVLCVEGEDIVIGYREAFNNNYLYVKKYDRKTDSWNALLDGTMQGNSVVVNQKGSLVYLLKNGTTYGNNGSYLYVYDLNSTNGSWIQVGANEVTTQSVHEADICFNSSIPYIAYSDGNSKAYVMEYKNEQWSQLGIRVSNQNMSGLKVYYENEKIYTTFLDLVTGRITVRSFVVKGEQENIPIDSVILNKENSILSLGESEVLTAVVIPANATELKILTWSSSNSSVAAVDSNGKVTGKKVGNAVISVQTSNGKTASCNFEIVNSNWRKNTIGYWYRNPDGSYPYNQWKYIDGFWYYFDPSGYRVTGWKLLGNTWYYMQDDGKMVTGDRTIGNSEYYFATSGAMVKGWQQRENNWYYYSSSGAMLKEAWELLGGNWFYFACDGKMVTGEKTIGGQSYFFMDSGAMMKGWLKRNNIWYYYLPGGAMVKSSWQLLGGIWYYFEDDGKMVTGEERIGGQDYYFNANGGMVKGWVWRNNNWYYYLPGGAMAKGGWQQLEGVWYYFEDSGKMVTGEKIIGEKEYYFKSNGAMVKGWLQKEDNWYYYLSNGEMVKGEWKFLGGGWYYLKEDGRMAVSEWIDKYYVDSNGRMV